MSDLRTRLETLAANALENEKRVKEGPRPVTAETVTPVVVELAALRARIKELEEALNDARSVVLLANDALADGDETVIAEFGRRGVDFLDRARRLLSDSESPEEK